MNLKPLPLVRAIKYKTANNLLRLRAPQLLLLKKMLFFAFFIAVFLFSVL